MDRNPDIEFLAGGGAVGALMRAHDWSSTPLGPPETWPDALRIPLRMMLSSRFEMWLGWGPDLAFFYNDAYRPTLGVKHPDVLGKPVREVWREIYSDVEDRIRSVMRDGIPTWDKGLLLLLERNGYPEETYHTFSYSPLYGSGGSVDGLMCVVTEETERIVSERRLDTLRALSSALVGSRSRADVIAAALMALGGNERDFPFSLIYLLDGAGNVTTKAANPEATHLLEKLWPFDKVRHNPVKMSLSGIEAIPAGPWSAPSTEALLVPIAKAGQQRPIGMLVLACNPFRPNDTTFEGFAELVAGQIAGALANIDAHDAEIRQVERFRELFAQSPSFMAVLLGRDHRFELANPAYLQFVGPRDLIGRTVLEVFPEVAGQGFVDLLDKVFTTGEPFSAHSMPISLRRTPDGEPEPRFIDFVYQPFRNAAGKIIGVFVEGFDVTSVHEANVARQNSEAQFRTFAEAVPNQVWASTPDGQLDWFNQTSLNYSGLSYENLFGDGWGRLVHPDDAPQVASAWQKCLVTGENYEIEFRIRRADGEYRWHVVRALPIRDANGAILRWIGTNTDIHERKLAEVESHRDRNRIWALSREMMIVCDFQGCITAVNPAAARIWDCSEEELVGQNIGDLIHPGDRDTWNTNARDLARLATNVAFTVRCVSRNGAEHVISWTGVSEGGRIHGVGRDITAEKEAEAALAAAEDALRQAQKMEAVGQLTGGIAHDFNNLLTGIGGSLDLLHARLPPDTRAPLQRYIDGAQSSAKRAAALTQRLLAFSRRQTLSPKPVNLGRLVRDMEELIRGSMGPAIEMQVRDEADWSTLADPNQLENALLNLCINSRDAMPDGGKLTIETLNTRLEGRAAIEIGLPEGNYVCLRVRDTGTGMTPEVLARAFDPFFTTKPLGQGTGLGLSMIYGFARQSGGQVSIVSEVGNGTQVDLYLPQFIGDENMSDTDAPHGRTDDLPKGATILIVDDEPIIRMLIVDTLEDAGLDCIEAGDGSAALKILQSGQPLDLLVTDVGLPGGMNGRQLADAGRELRPSLKVLFITGYAEKTALGDAHLNAGMQVLTKPFVPEDLARKIAEMLAE